MVHPFRGARRRVDGEDVVGAGDRVDDALVLEGLRLARILGGDARLQVDVPDPFQLCHVGRVDLVQGGVAVVRDRAAVGDPVVARRARELLGRERRSRGTAAARCRETDHHDGRDHGSRPDELEQTPMTAVECEEAMHRVSFGVG